MHAEKYCEKKRSHIGSITYFITIDSCFQSIFVIIILCNIYFSLITAYLSVTDDVSLPSEELQEIG